MTTPELICPKCSQSDQVQKVTSLYNANTKEWYETRYRTDSNGMTHNYQEKHTAHTLLGQQLAPPDQPKVPVNPTIWYGIGCLIAGFIISTVCGTVIPIGAAPLIIVLFGLAQSSDVPPDLANLPTWVGIAMAALLFVGALASIGFLAWTISFFKRKYDESMAKHKERKAQVDNEVMPRWQRAMERWNNMYFCARDESVFIPSENKAIPATQMKKYLFDPYFRPF